MKNCVFWVMTIRHWRSDMHFIFIPPMQCMLISASLNWSWWHIATGKFGSRAGNDTWSAISHSSWLRASFLSVLFSFNFTGLTSQITVFRVPWFRFRVNVIRIRLTEPSQTLSLSSWSHRLHRNFPDAIHFVNEIVLSILTPMVHISDLGRCGHLQY